MRQIGIGHNSREFEAGYRLRRRQWQTAKAAVAMPRLSAAQVKRRIARAEELGLSLAQYQSIRLATGRDPRALLLTPEGMGLRLSRRLSLPDFVCEKLDRLRHCHLLAIAPDAEDPRDFLAELRAESRLPFAAAGTMPGTGAGWGAVRQALAPALSPLSLPGDAILLIGTPDAGDPGLAAAIRAAFLPGTDYFPRPDQADHGDLPSRQGGNAA